MPSVTTEGIILKRKNFGEADRVITVLTDRYGKISIIARGVRKITSRRAGNVELLNRVKLHLFKSKGFTLIEAESIETFPKIKENLTLSTTAFHVIELIDRLLPVEQINRRVYDLTVAVLQTLEQNPRQIFIRAFEVKLLSMLGFWSIDAVKNLNFQTRNFLKNLEYNSWENIIKMQINKGLALDLERVLVYYTENILESSLKSRRVLGKLKVE